MFSKTTLVGHAVLTVVLISAPLLSQHTSAVPSASAGHEFPVLMQQNVVAGKTPVGTVVHAKLVVATLVEGVVVPRDATFSGEVTESSAKSATDPSRLAIRMDSAQWKKGAIPIKVYLTAWYYPETTMPAQDLSYEPADAARNNRKNWNGMGTYPDPNNPVSQQKFPGRDTEKDTGLALPSVSRISQHRVLMKNVESTRHSDGALTLTSKRSNIKIDKLTTYVLATGDLLPMK
jgi:hypothetical protein